MPSWRGTLAPIWSSVVRAEGMKNHARLGMSARAFLSRFWQKKPLFVRAGIPDFVDPLTPEELAGLACEDGVESRLVDSRTWRVHFGPHPESAFRKLPKTHWTLLVQEVQRFVPEAARLLDAFSFLPNHRIDDVMVSFAPKGGTVGPHDDSYDVFLVQGQGRRRWQIDARTRRDRALKTGLDLKILKRFEPQEELVCERGDILYVPPGVAHHGVALGDCLTYSIGFRAPNRGELWHELVHDAAETKAAEPLYRDPNIAECKHPGELDLASRKRVREMVRALDLSDGAIDRFFGRFATRLKPGHDLAAPPSPMTTGAFAKRWRRGDAIARSEECRFSYFRSGGSLLFYCGGHEIPIAPRLLPLAQLVSERRRFSSRDTSDSLAKDPKAQQFLTALANHGAIFFARAKS